MTIDEIRENQKIIDNLKKTIERKEKLDKLYENELFKEVILEGYLRVELDKLMSLQNYFAINATPSTVSFADQPDKLTQKQIEAIGLFKYFLDTVKKQGREAEESLKEIENSSNQM